MKYRALEDIQWHDLPVEELRLSSKGIHMVVSPFEESEQAYAEVCLVLSSIEDLNVSITGSPLGDDLANIEVVSFGFVHLRPNEVSGSIELLPGQAGLRRISFSRAKWELCAPNNSLQARRP
jgi:hypothetical protein